ncbi:MAG: zinc ribbon-containing protein [Deltaproteobacteria bacterium]|nr:zinc ribbon-containing protein [Deltaproteobacteria bacterium]
MATKDDAKKKLVEVYEKMSVIVKKNLDKAEVVTEEALEKAIKESKAWAAKQKVKYGPEVQKAADALRRDFQSRLTKATEETKKGLNLERLGAGILSLTQRVAKTVGVGLDHFADKLNDKITCHTGEVTGAGTLTCAKCGAKVKLTKASLIPECPKCGHNTFRRGY